jgi:hypothetical protein
MVCQQEIVRATGRGTREGTQQTVTEQLVTVTDQLVWMRAADSPTWQDGS